MSAHFFLLQTEGQGRQPRRKTPLIATANGRANLRKTAGKGTFSLHFVGDFLVLFSRMQFTSVNFFFFTQKASNFYFNTV